jgi:hypothetical protein
MNPTPGDAPCTIPNGEPTDCPAETAIPPDMPTRTRRRPSAALPTPENAISYAALVEYLASRAVIELVVVEGAPGVFQVHVLLSWRAGRSVLVAEHGQPRTFRSLDRLATLLKTAGLGITLVRLELLT